MNHLLCFGFGFSASTLATRLDPTQWRVSGTSRTQAGVAAIVSRGAEGLLFDELKAIPNSVTHIVVSIPPDDSGDPVLARFAGELAARAAQFQWVAYLSTTGVYGDHGGGWIDEKTPLTPNTTRGTRRVEAEAAWQSIKGLPLHIFRLAGIYGPGRNSFEALRKGTAKRVIKAGQVFSRIHVGDIAGVLLASMSAPRPGAIYNVADDEPCPPEEVVTYAAGLLGLDPPPEVPFAEAKLSPMARSFYADSKRTRNELLKKELGYRFQYPTYREGLQALLETIKS